MDSLILPRCDTEMMRIFLAEVSQRHRDRHVLTFMDQAGWHATKKLALPDNITIDFLPPRSPQCNPQEPVWKVLRRDILGNRHFNSPAEVSKATAAGLQSLENNQTFLKGLCDFDRIITSLLNRKVCIYAYVSQREFDQSRYPNGKPATRKKPATTITMATIVMPTQQWTAFA